MTKISEKRVIVVTGAGSGIGRACANRLASADVSVIALDRDRAAAAETIKSIERTGCFGFAVECDVTQRAVVEEVFHSIHRVDVLVKRRRGRRKSAGRHHDGGYAAFI